MEDPYNVLFHPQASPRTSTTYGLPGRGTEYWYVPGINSTYPVALRNASEESQSHSLIVQRDGKLYILIYSKYYVGLGTGVARRGQEKDPTRVLVAAPPVGW